MKKETIVLRSAIRIRVLAPALLLVCAYLTIAGISNHAAQAEGICDDCRMTGGGIFISSQDETTRITHGFELHCGNPAPSPNNLEINFGGNRFHLESVTSITCFDDESIEPPPPAAPCDTLELIGEGRYNGRSGFSIIASLTDAGEPGRNDTATFVIRDPEGNFVLRTTGNLKGGNHQAHEGNK